MPTESEWMKLSSAHMDQLDDPECSPFNMLVLICRTLEALKKVQEERGEGEGEKDEEERKIHKSASYSNVISKKRREKIGIPEFQREEELSYEIIRFRMLALADALNSRKIFVKLEGMGIMRLSMEEKNNIVQCVKLLNSSYIKTSLFISHLEELARDLKIEKSSPIGSFIILCSHCIDEPLISNHPIGFLNKMSIYMEQRNIILTQMINKYSKHPIVNELPINLQEYLYTYVDNNYQEPRGAIGEPNGYLILKNDNNNNNGMFPKCNDVIGGGKIIKSNKKRNLLDELPTKEANRLNQLYGIKQTHNDDDEILGVSTILSSITASVITENRTPGGNNNNSSSSNNNKTRSNLSNSTQQSNNTSSKRTSTATNTDTTDMNINVIDNKDTSVVGELNNSNSMQPLSEILRRNIERERASLTVEDNNENDIQSGENPVNNLMPQMMKSTINDKNRDDFNDYPRSIRQPLVMFDPYKNEVPLDSLSMTYQELLKVAEKSQNENIINMELLTSLEEQNLLGPLQWAAYSGAIDVRFLNEHDSPLNIITNKLCPLNTSSEIIPPAYYNIDLSALCNMAKAKYVNE